LRLNILSASLNSPLSTDFTFILLPRQILRLSFSLPDATFDWALSRPLGVRLPHFLGVRRGRICFSHPMRRVIPRVRRIRGRTGSIGTPTFGGTTVDLSTVRQLRVNATSSNPRLSFSLSSVVFPIHRDLPGLARCFCLPSSANNLRGAALGGRPCGRSCRRVRVREVVS
jgi:hypothetical protein